MKNIKVYTKNSCQVCNMTTKFLERNGIKFEAINIEDEGNEHLVDFIKEELGFMTMPVVAVNDAEFFSGFQPDKLEKLKED